MNFYPETQIVEVVLPFVDSNGNAINPAEISAHLYDGEDEVLMVYDAVPFDPVGVEAKLVIHSALNTLRGDELSEIRRVEFKVAHAGGKFTVSKTYVVEAEQSLQIMRNSFMTYDTAILTSSGLVNVSAFNGAPDDRKKAALVEAFRRICGLSMVYSILNADGVACATHKISADVWDLITKDTFITQFPSAFRRALRHAQIAEADELLQGNVLTRKLAQGIASETIGESSVTFRDGIGSGAGAGVSPITLSILSGFIDRTIVIGRV
jgi:hypothetical protein